MSTLEKRKEKLETSKERLKQQEKLIKLREQKEKSKDIHQLGKIAKKASLLDIDKKALLGAFLEIAERSKENNEIEKWKERAQNFSVDKTEEEMDSVVVTFSEEPSAEAKKKIKEHKLRWNRFRNEWYGYAHINDVKASLETLGATVESV